MKVGKIAQLTTHDLAGVRVAASTVADALDGPALLARIVRLEVRQTNSGECQAEMKKMLAALAVRVQELENRKSKGAK